MYISLCKSLTDKVAPAKFTKFSMSDLFDSQHLSNRQKCRVSSLGRTDYSLNLLVWVTILPGDLFFFQSMFFFVIFKISFFCYSCKQVWAYFISNCRKFYFLSIDIYNKYKYGYSKTLQRIFFLTFEIYFRSLWPCPLTLGHRFQYVPSQCSKKPFNENCIKIDASVRLECCSLTDTQTPKVPKFKTQFSLHF